MLPDLSFLSALSGSYLLFSHHYQKKPTDGKGLGMDILIRNAAMNLWRRDSDFTRYNATLYGYIWICPKTSMAGYPVLCGWQSILEKPFWSYCSVIKGLKNAQDYWISNSISRVCPKEQAIDKPKALPTEMFLAALLIIDKIVETIFVLKWVIMDRQRNRT